MKTFLDNVTVFIYRYYMIQLVVLPVRERPPERRVERLRSSPWLVQRLPPPLGAGQGRDRPPPQASAPVRRYLIAVQPKLTHRELCVPDLGKDLFCIRIENQGLIFLRSVDLLAM